MYENNRFGWCSVFLILSGWALAAQKTEQKRDPSTIEHISTMEHMMKEGTEDEHMGGMVRMMKMMDQCSKMMESGQSDSSDTKQKRM
jgi:hypothetical protein